jgi:chromate transporter
VNLFILYLLLLKAVLVSFSGMSSLPIVHNDLVVDRKALTERELNTAVAVARLGPGPLGLYIVCVGYYAAGVPGAVAGCLAMMTPAFLAVPLVRKVGEKAQHRTVRRMIRAITLGAAGMLVSSTIPLARDALVSPVAIIIAGASFAILTLTRIDTFWVVLGAAGLGILANALGYGY